MADKVRMRVPPEYALDRVVLNGIEFEVVDGHIEVPDSVTPHFEAMGFTRERRDRTRRQDGNDTP